MTRGTKWLKHMEDRSNRNRKSDKQGGRQEAERKEEHREMDCVSNVRSCIREWIVLVENKYGFPSSASFSSKESFFLPAYIQNIFPRVVFPPNLYFY